MSSTSSRRRTQRQPLSCTECTRRKLRCSKVVPCSCCIDRGQADSCRREVVQVSSKAVRQRTPRSNTGIDGDARTTTITPSSSREHSAPFLEPPPVEVHEEQHSASLSSPLQGQDDAHPAPSGDRNIFHATNEAAITLEFLALGRQHILNNHHASTPSTTHSRPGIEPTVDLSSQPDTRWPGPVSPAQGRQLLYYHQQYLAWMHNVIHGPSFYAEFEANLCRESVADKSWLALYYAIVCTTLYHADEDSLSDMGLHITVKDVAAVHDQCLQLLHEANFMAVHTLQAIQTISILLQVSHNLGQSDLVSVLLSCAVRIAQSLNLHRVGADRSQNAESSEHPTQILIDREIKKRVWWSLIRQDWLQIPFQNTYSIHITQFNTPMPSNCHEDPLLMIADGKIVDRPRDTYTQNSYTNILNEISILVWRHQERLVSVGHPKTSSDGLRNLYEQVLRADEELRHSWRELPIFLRDESIEFELPPYRVSHLKRIHHLSMAHKIFTIHRHFQLQSFKDNWYAHTRMSCVLIAQRCLRDIEAWPEDTSTMMITKMWTVITHTVSCSVILVFALIFNRDDYLMYDVPEMRRLALVGRNTISGMRAWSTIAERGVKTIDVLLEFEQAMAEGQGREFSVEDVIAHVKGDGNASVPDPTMDPDHGMLPREFSWDSTLAFMFDVYGNEDNDNVA
ncbi:Fc.00g027300.m01.CDS01 [Cosmosporella sp. VM-42]